MNHFFQKKFLTMNYELESELTPILGSGEKIRWIGKPRAGIFLQGSDFFLIPFSIFWCSFIAFWEYSAYKAGAPIFFMLFGIPFIVIGIYLLFGRFFIDAKIREKAIYAVTQHRIILKSGFWTQAIQSLDIKTLPPIHIHQKLDNSGTITFGTARKGYSPPSFEHIQDVQEVYNIIVSLRS